MQKINTSGYSKSTQANLNNTSIHFLPSLSPPSLSWTHNQDDIPCTPSPGQTSIYTFTSAAVIQLYFICRRALAPLRLFKLISNLPDIHWLPKSHRSVSSVNVKLKTGTVVTWKPHASWKNSCCGPAQISYPLLTIISQAFCLSGERALPSRSSLTGTHTNTKGYFILLSAVSVTVSSFPPPPHTLMAVARSGWTGGCRNRWVLASAENPESDTNGPKERQRGTAPSGPDTAQPASSKTQI